MALSKASDIWADISAGKPPQSLDQPEHKDYPGNTTPRNRPGGEKYEQHSQAKKGERSYKLALPDGSIKTFYTISTVARIFGRRTVTIRSWEDRGDLPRPKYRTPKPRGKHLGSAPAGRRLYTQEQVDYLVLLCERYNMMDHYRADWEGFRQAMADYPSD
jgi:hypothetical protein